MRMPGGEKLLGEEGYAAIGLLEFDSIAAGIVAGDAMAKRSPLEALRAGTVHPGKYLVLIGGGVAEVIEGLVAGRAVGGSALLDELFLPAVDRSVLRALAQRPLQRAHEALGVIETCTVAAVLSAADAAVKEAGVELQELALADGLGGKAYALFGGTVHDVEVAVARGAAQVPAGLLVRQVVISQLDESMRANLQAGGEFARSARLAPLTPFGAR